MKRTIEPPVAQSLELFRVDADHWIVRDHAFPSSDARHVVGCVNETDEGDFDVVWLLPQISLPTRYRDVGDVLEDLARWRSPVRSGGRPVEIPHFQPLRATPASSQPIRVSPGGETRIHRNP